MRATSPAFQLLFVACLGCGDAEPRMPVDSGYIEVRQNPLSASAMAGFFSATGPLRTSETIGACVVTQVVPDRDEPTIDQLTAGAITIAGGREGVSLLPQGTDGYYPAWNANAMLFSGGETLTFTVVGSEVPGFSDSLTAPTRVMVTSPQHGSNNSLTIDAAADLTVAWTDGGAGDVRFVLESTANTQPRMACDFSAEALVGTIPQRALAPFKDLPVDYTIWSQGSASVVAGKWNVTLRALYVAVFPDFEGAGGRAAIY